MLLGFKSDARGLKNYHLGPYGLIRDGEFMEYPEAEAERLLSDFPYNFFKPQKKSFADFAQEVMEEAKKTESVVEAAPDKMVTEQRPVEQKKKMSKKRG